MNTSKVYKDSDGNDCSIHQMIKREPGWSASIIQHLESENEKLKDKLDHITSKCSSDICYAGMTEYVRGRNSVYEEILKAIHEAT